MSGLDGLLHPASDEGAGKQPVAQAQEAASYPSPPLTAEGSPLALAASDAALVQEAGAGVPPLDTQPPPAAPAAAAPTTADALNGSMELDPAPEAAVVVPLSQLPAAQVQLAPTSLASHDQSDASVVSASLASPGVSLAQDPLPASNSGFPSEPSPLPTPVQETSLPQETQDMDAEPSAVAAPTESIHLTLHPQAPSAVEEPPSAPYVQAAQLPADSSTAPADNPLSQSVKRQNSVDPDDLERAAKRPKQEDAPVEQPYEPFSAAGPPMTADSLDAIGEQVLPSAQLAASPADATSAATATTTTSAYPDSAQPYPVRPPYQEPLQLQLQAASPSTALYSSQTSAAATPLDTTSATTAAAYHEEPAAAAYVAPTDYHPAPAALPPIAFNDPSRPFVQRPYIDMTRAPAPLPKEQQKYANSILKALKKSKDAVPFLSPVDPVYLGLPTYYAVVTDPMDLMTLEKKLHQHCYGHADDFIADARKIFRNCYMFNGEAAPVSLMGKSLEALFEKMVLKMPPAYAYKPAPSPSGAGGPKPPKHRKDPYAADARPKREVHAPSAFDALDDYAPAAPPKKKHRPAAPAHAYGGPAEEIRFCKEVWRELTKKGNAHFNWVFLEPVDYVKLNLPDYPKIVKRPMDLSTMKRKLDGGEYASADAFHRDFKLLISNCYAYNPPGTDVHRMGQQLDAIFEAKWLEKPDPYSEYGSGSESDEQITMMERQLEMMRQNLVSMKSAKQRRKDEKREQANQAKREAAAAARRAAEAAAAAHAAAAAAARPPPPPPQPRAPPNGAAAGPKQVKAPRRASTNSAPKARRAGKYSSDDEFVAFQEVTFEMKQALANGIAAFEGEQLQRAIDIIRKSRPDLLGDETKEIELDIDQLDANTLLKLYNYVVGPPKKSRVKQETLTASGQKAQKGGRAGTGGLKGKSLDEAEETARIRALEAQLSRFNEAAAAGEAANAPSMPTNKADVTGMTSSDEDSDASDSDSE